MTDNSLNISIPIKFDIKTAPRGMTDFDPKALSSNQQIELNAHKMDLRRENFLFLAEHPEVRGIVQLILRMTIVQKPRDIVHFVANIFTRPIEELRKEITSILNETDIEYSTIPYCPEESWDY